MNNPINRFNVYDYLIVFLLALFVFNSTAQNLWSNSVTHVLTSVVIAVALDLALSFLKTRIRKPKEGQVGVMPFKLHIPKSAIVSGLIIGLLIEPVAFGSAEMLPVILAPILAIFLKNVIRIKGDHIFNPATLGLLITMVLLSSSLSWWAASPPWLVVIFGLFIVYRLKRPNPAIVFLVVYSLLLLLPDAAANKLSQDSLLQLYSGTTFFFGFIMVQEPVTAPRGGKGRLLFGLIAAILAFAFTPYFPKYSYLLGLLVADLFVLPINWKLR